MVDEQITTGTKTRHVTWRSTKENISNAPRVTHSQSCNKPNVYIMSAKSARFRQEEIVENFQWLVHQDKIILELKDQPAPMENIYIVSKEFQDYTFWNEITHCLVNCSSNLNHMRNMVQMNLGHLPSAYLKVNSLFNM